MRTRFVIHKNLLSPVYRVIKHPEIYAVTPGGDVQLRWNPDAYPVDNPKRPGTWFALPKSDYLPCDKNGVVKNAEATYLAECGSKQEGGSEVNHQDQTLA